MYQKVIIVGNVGQEPDLKDTPSGSKVCNLSVAANQKWKDRDGQTQERTVWFNVACWNRLGETVAQWLHKGSLVLVEGEIREARAYTTRNGELRASIDMQAFTVKFLPDGRGSSSASAPAMADSSPTAAYDDISVVGADEIPF